MTITADDVVELVRIQLGARNVQPSDRFQEDLDAESADVLNIVATAEDRWGVAIGEEEMIELTTVNDLLDLILRRVTGS
jgi:acyl carrier protein